MAGALLERFTSEADFEANPSRVIRIGESKPVRHGPNNLRVKCDLSGLFAEIILVYRSPGTREEGTLINVDGDQIDFELKPGRKTKTRRFGDRERVILYAPTELSKSIEFSIIKS